MNAKPIARASMAALAPVLALQGLERGNRPGGSRRASGRPAAGVGLRGLWTKLPRASSPPPRVGARLYAAASSP